ncbi:MAG: zinc-ribbon domain-containing protein [Cyanobacteria bacterium P01_H01_bin.21]
MAYVCEFSPGHQVYLDNQGDQTIITSTVATPGQQQQASNSITTGPWTAPPKAYQNLGGAIFTLFTAQGEIHISIQGTSVSMTSAPAGSQQLSMQQTSTAVPPMPPMQPMTMGNMQMTMQPMEMRVGNMELKMETQSSTTRQFCSQCGKKVAPEDRFCSSCGHALN